MSWARPGRHVVRRTTLAACVLAAGTPSQAAALVGTTTAADAFSSASRFFTHCANGYCWVAYHDGTTPVIASSPDGVAWTAQGPIFSAVSPSSAGQWAPRYSGTNVIAFGTNPVNPRRRWYRNATLNNNGTVTWNAPDDQAVSAAGQLEINSLIASAKPIAYYVDPTSWGDEVIGSQLNGPVWTTAPPVPPSPSGASTGGFSAGAMFPTGGSDPNDFILLRATTTTPYTPGAHRLLADRFDANVPVYVSNLQWYNVSMNGLPPGPYGIPESMDTEVKEGTDAQAHTRFAAVRDTSGNLHAVYVNRNDNVAHYRKAVGFNDTWSRLFVDVTGSVNPIDKVALSAVLNNNLFLFYSRSDGGIYHRRFDGTNWGGETTLKPASATPLQGALAPMELAYGCPLGIAWAEGSASPFNVMFAFVDACRTLSTSVAGSTITVDTADVKMVWDAGVAGGGLSEFYGKTEANPGVNRRGDSAKYNVFSTQLNDGSTWYFERSGAGSAELLEATATRVRLRQSYDYTAQMHLSRDWSIYAYPRLAIDEDLVLDVDQGTLRGAQGLHPKGVTVCGGANTFYCAGQSDEPNRIWVATDDAGAYSDMLAIPYTTPFFGRGGTTYGWNNAFEAATGTPDTWLARVHESTDLFTGMGTYTRRYLFYPNLPGLTSSGTEWQPFANDYRSPDVLTFNFSVGTGWEDPNENTAAGDFFNEAEGAYAVDFNPTSGLSVNIDGDVTNHKKPFFKIRQWRSMQDPPSVTLQGTTLVNDVDFKADVKPVARAYFCSPGCTQIAQGGLVPQGNEYLADPTPAMNFPMNFTGANYLYLGAEVRFRGLNFALATPGAGTADLRWEYWNGASWLLLEGSTGYTDQTNNLKRSGTIYWGSDSPELDPIGWAPTSVSGSPQLFFVRARLDTGSYTTQPVEGLIKTDVLLFQYCGDITALDDTFVFAPPVPTAVELSSFTAVGLDAAVELAWTTASELQNLGFHLYRSVSPSGPYEQITASLVPGLGSSPTGASYRYRDAGLQNGQTYYYQLEDVETTGKTKRHGPLSATPAAGAGAGGDGGPDPDAGPGDSDRDSSRMRYGNPEGVTLRILERGANHTMLELLTPGFYAVSQGDGTLRLEIPGFDSRSVPGAPAVPVKRTLVEAVAGRRARISSIEPFDEVLFGALRVGEAEASEMVVTAEGTVTAGLERKRGSRHEGLFPRELARLLGVSFQGETKKARIELSPLRYDASTGTTVLVKRLRVRLEFAGRDPAEAALGGSRGRRPLPRRARPGVLAELMTPEAGLYGVSFEEVFGRGQRGILASSLELTHRGEPVGYHLVPEGALFAQSSVLYFLSEGSTSNPWGDTVYELALGAGALHMPVVDAAPAGGHTAEYFERKQWEENRYYQAGLLEAPDLWLWDLLVSPVTKSYPLTLSALSSSGSSAQLSVWLQGASDFEADPDHHVRLLVNGTVVGEASWDGRTEQRLEAEVFSGLLRDGDNTLSLENVGDTGASYSMVFLNRFELSYPRRLQAEGGQLSGKFEQSGTAEVLGIGAMGKVLDTRESLPKWLEGVVATSTGLSFRAEAGGSYLVVAPDSVKRASVRQPVTSRLRSRTNRADWVLIGPREMLVEAEPLVQLRISQGLAVQVVPVEEIYQEFGHGEVSPAAIRDFLAYTYHSWARPSLRYVLLLGDGTYDPKDHLKTGVKDHIPPYPLKTTYLWTASDPAYASVNGDDLLPDVALGRLSASSVEQARALIAKLLAFETAGASGARRCWWRTTPTSRGASKPTPRRSRPLSCRGVKWRGSTCATWAGTRAPPSSGPSTTGRGS